MFDKLHEFLENISAIYIAGMSLFVVLCLGFVDYISGPEISFSVFYMAPIMVATWYSGRSIGFLISVTSAFAWYVADVSTDRQYSHMFVPVWNTGVRLTFFLLVTVLISIIKEKLAFEESLADTDVLTNLANRRFFMERVDIERSRGTRYNEVCTIAYIDIDNFKHINDTRGHLVGDEVLQHVARCLTEGVREVDLAARLGGDEFAVLFPLLGYEDAMQTLENSPVFKRYG